MIRPLAHTTLSATLLATVASAQTPLLRIDNPISGAIQFGAAVDGGRDLDGDGVPDHVVGAPSEGPGGRVRVYSGATAAERYALDAEAAGDSFGASLALVDDVDGDGCADLVVGAPLHDGAAANAGRLYLFSGDAGTLLGTLDGSPVTHAQLGASVAGLEDLDGDGFGDVLAGEPQAAGPGDGRAVVISGALLAAGSGEAAVIAAHGPVLGPLDCCPRFGVAVAAAGDVDADGVPDYVVGAPWQRELPQDGENTGAASVYSGATHTLLGIVHGDDHGNQFGIAVGAAGDANADGYADIAVGATRCIAGDNDLPYVRVLSGAHLAGAGGPLELHTWSEPGLGICSGFGASVAGVGDANGDGYDDLAVGVIHDDTAGTNLGSVRGYSGLDGSPLFTVLGEPGRGLLGAVVRSAGDVNRDGVPDLVAGAPWGWGAAWVLSARPVPYPPATATPVGVGCSGDTTPPQLGATPPVLGETFSLSLTDAAPLQSGWLLLGPPPPVVLIERSTGCGLYTSVTAIHADVSTSIVGAWTLDVEVPYHYFLAGHVLHAQAVLMGSGGPTGRDLSNGLILTIGI